MRSDEVQGSNPCRVMFFFFAFWASAFALTIIENSNGVNLGTKPRADTIPFFMYLFAQEKVGPKVGVS